MLIFRGVSQDSSWDPTWNPLRFHFQIAGFPHFPKTLSHFFDPNDHIPSGKCIDSKPTFPREEISYESEAPIPWWLDIGWHRWHHVGPPLRLNPILKSMKILNRSIPFMESGLPKSVGKTVESPTEKGLVGDTMVMSKTQKTSYGITVGLFRRIMNHAQIPMKPENPVFIYLYIYITQYIYINM